MEEELDLSLSGPVAKLEAVGIVYGKADFYTNPKALSCNKRCSPNESALHTCTHQLAEIYRWSPIYNGLIYDILILQWYKMR